MILTSDKTHEKFNLKKDNDLRNPKNLKIKRDIFSFFGLDADKSYAKNLKKNNSK